MRTSEVQFKFKESPFPVLHFLCTPHRPGKRAQGCQQLLDLRKKVGNAGDLSRGDFAPPPGLCPGSILHITIIRLWISIGPALKSMIISWKLITLRNNGDVEIASRILTIQHSFLSSWQEELDSGNGYPSSNETGLFRNETLAGFCILWLFPHTPCEF